MVEKWISVSDIPLDDPETVQADRAIERFPELMERSKPFFPPRLVIEGPPIFDSHFARMFLKGV